MRDILGDVASRKGEEGVPFFCGYCGEVVNMLWLDFKLTSDVNDFGFILAMSR